MRHHTAKRPQSIEPEQRKTRLDELLEKIRLERQQILQLMENERTQNGKTAQIDHR